MHLCVVGALRRLAPSLRRLAGFEALIDCGLFHSRYVLAAAIVLLQQLDKVPFEGGGGAGMRIVSSRVRQRGVFRRLEALARCSRAGARVPFFLFPPRPAYARPLAPTRPRCAPLSGAADRVGRGEGALARPAAQAPPATRQRPGVPHGGHRHSSSGCNCQETQLVLAGGIPAVGWPTPTHPSPTRPP